jgi:2-(1,2-epoxy-1,2-dihydrophenyl)acetyl-CoA isomerase
VTSPGEPTHVRLETRGPVATVTLDGPSSRNSLSGPTGLALAEAMTRVAADDTIRAVLLTGANGAFSAGADLRELEAGHREGAAPDLGRVVREGLNPLILAVSTMPKPVVAAIPGAAAGAGMSLALACDIRLAARSAVFSTAFAGIGLTADAGLSWLLPRIVGTARATAMLLLPERLPADRALELGLVQAVLADDLLADTARELTEKLAAGPTAAYASIKRSVAYSATVSLPDALAHEAELQQAMGYTEDHRDAVQAFLRRETPVFRGR